MVIRVIGTEQQTAAFTFLWAKYVSGLNEAVHCARCLVGPYSKVVKLGIGTGEHILDTPFNAWDYFYLCGVTRHWNTNLHLAARPSPGRVATVTSYNGVTFGIPDFEAIPIQPLPAGFRGYDAKFTTCRNWQFGVQQYNPSS